MFLGRELYELEQMEERGETIDPTKVDPWVYKYYLSQRFDESDFDHLINKNSKKLLTAIPS